MNENEFRKALNGLMKNFRKPKIVEERAIHIFAIEGARAFREINPDVYGSIDPSDLATVISVSVKNVLYENAFNLEQLRHPYQITEQICNN